MSDKNYLEFSFEDFLQDDYFISSMKKPTPETSEFWEQFRKGNQNLMNFEAAKAYVESINQYHSTLSLEEIDDMRRAIHKKKNRMIRNRRMYYWGVGAAAAGIALLIFFKFQGADNMDSLSSKPDIATFAETLLSDTKTGEIQLVLSDEQTIFFDRKETVITYDTTGIVVDKEVIAKSETTGFNQLIVPLGKRSILHLPDGTKVWVNSDSRLIYPVSFANDRREIYIDGEIYIEVTEDTRRPFVVRTRDIDVQVLGTRFNVTAYEDDEKKIVLVSGLVQIVSKKGENITHLLPDQMYCTGNGEDHVETVDTRKHISWIDGIYYCEDENLETILQRLSRYYGVEITCDPSVAGVVFSGKLDLKENIFDIFKGISFTLPVSITENEGKYLISRLK